MTSSSSDILNKICMIVAFDGYDLKCPVVEIAYFSITNPKQLKVPNKSLTFDLRKDLVNDSSLEDYLLDEKKIEYYLEEFLKELYTENKTTDKYLVGYISEYFEGNYEKNILDKLEIPSINIEKEFDFPDRLIDEFKLSRKIDEFLCSKHSGSKYISKNYECFCPNHVTICFGKWLLKQISINDKLNKLCMVVGFFEEYDDKNCLNIEMAYFSMTNPNKLELPNESFKFNLQKKSFGENEQYLLEEILRDLYELNKTTDKYLVVYVGYEDKDVLKKLEIPFVYMTEFDCPEKDLINDFTFSDKYDSFLCEHHREDKYISNDIEYFCPKLLTVCYGEWLLEEISTRCIKS